MVAIDRYIVNAKVELAETLDAILTLQREFLAGARGPARLQGPFIAADQILTHPRLKSFDKAAVLAAVLAYRDQTVKAAGEPGAFDGIPANQQVGLQVLRGDRLRRPGRPGPTQRRGSGPGRGRARCLQGRGRHSRRSLFLHAGRRLRPDGQDEGGLRRLPVRGGRRPRGRAGQGPRVLCQGQRQARRVRGGPRGQAQGPAVRPGAFQGPGRMEGQGGAGRALHRLGVPAVPGRRPGLRRAPREHTRRSTWPSSNTTCPSRGPTR